MRASLLKVLGAAVYCAAVYGAGEVAAGYDFDDPNAAHTTAAIAFDRNGKRGDSRRAFESAARYTPSTNTMVNLGVCYMRLASGSGHRAHKLELYGLAYDAMKRGGEVARGDDDRRLFEENWDALMTNFQIEHVAMPDEDDANAASFEDLAPDHRVCGGGGGGGGLPPSKKSAFEQLMGFGSRSLGLESGDPATRRDFLVHQQDAPIAPPLPRVNATDLERRRRYRDREEPFILVGATEGWAAVAEAGEDAWAWLESLADLWPDAVTDFYPYNMLSRERQSPYLTRLGAAVRELRIEAGAHQQLAGSKFRYEGGRGALDGRYLHLQLPPDSWAKLEADGQIPAERHPHLENDAWLEDCLGYPDSAVAAEYHLKTHWKILIAGARGAGMFNHSDSLQTSSWHAHVVGRKWWHVCGALGDGKRACFEAIVEPGEVLYYGRGWHHETQNLASPTITLTDTAVHEKNFAAVADKLHGECAAEVLDFKFSGALCDALDACYNALHRRFKGGRDKPPSMWRPWRGLASPALIDRRDKTNPVDNNYDGRNYITE